MTPMERRHNAIISRWRKLWKEGDNWLAVARMVGKEFGVSHKTVQKVLRVNHVRPFPMRTWTKRNPRKPDMPLTEWAERQAAYHEDQPTGQLLADEIEYLLKAEQDIAVRKQAVIARVKKLLED